MTSTKTKFTWANRSTFVLLLVAILMSTDRGLAQPESEIMSRTLNLDVQSFANQLGETSPAPGKTVTVQSTILLTMADGQPEAFAALPSDLMHPDFAQQFPEFKVYRLQSLDNSEKTGRLSVTPQGVTAFILGQEGVTHLRPIDPVNTNLHKVGLYNLGSELIECNFSQVLEQTLEESLDPVSTAVANGATLRTYTLAIVCTGEFHDANGGSVPAATTVAMNSVMAIEAIFERELSVNFQLLTPFIYPDPDTDPFNPGLDMTLEAAQAVEANFNGQNYDLGHVFHDQDQGRAELGTGGVAGLGVVCDNTPDGTGFRKASAWSGSFDNVTPGWIKLVTHEFGHQFNMTHTFNGDGFNCTTGNHPLNTAYEIGSGTTIMSYQGICDAQYNIPDGGLADHYFHANSLDRAVTYMGTQACHAAALTGNNPPVANADPCNNGPYTIPISTPFRLTGAGTDGNGDQIFYTWEQYDEDGANVEPTHGFIGPQAAGSAIAPLFRSFPPSTSPTRTFPNMNLVRNNDYTSSFEPLPTVARTLNFRLTARDFRMNGGGIDCKPLAVTVSANGPLTVTSPNGGENLNAGAGTNVTWNVNGTDNICGTVNIRLSTDGGFTFPYTLAAGTPHDGFENVNIPAGVANTNGGRIMVESACNTCVVFFDISNADFVINSTCLAQSSNICPLTPVNLPAASPGLNLNMNQYFGNAITQLNFNFDNGDPTGPLANATLDGGTTCQTIWGTEPYEAFDFAVSSTGAYTITTQAGFFVSLAVFNANGYDPANPCNSNFLGSNTTGAIMGGGDVTVNLNQCTVYKAVVWTTNGTNGPGTITFAGPGSVYSSGAGPGAGYSYTYTAINTANGQVALSDMGANFTTLAAGSYNIYGASYYSGAGPQPPTVNPNNWTGMTLNQILSGGSCVLFSSNFRSVTVTGGGGCTPPTINSVMVVQPTCQTPTGTITVNANGTSALEYSVNNGTTWQNNGTFANQNPGTYNVVVRLANNQACFTNYAQNPVTLNAPMGCGGNNCTDYNAVDVPMNITDNNTITSTINVPTGGTIADVNIKNLIGTHTFVGDLTFTLMSPMGTSVILIQNQCGGVADFNISLDDAAANALNCPISDAATEQPENPLAAFNGQNPMGNWMLMVNDNAGGDEGQLTGWTLEICTQQICTPPNITSVMVVQPTCQTPTGTITVNANGTSALEYSVNNGTTWQNNGTFANQNPGMYNVVVRLANNQACLTNYAQNPVTLNTPMGCGGNNCTDYIAADVPINITDNNTITSTINVPTGGTIADVNIKNLTGTHSWVGDLTFTLMSPMGTSVVLIQNQCGGVADFNISLDDAAANALNCPISDAATEQPENPLAAFNGQNPMGNWVLMVNDNADGDEGQLTGWTLEICTQGGVNCQDMLAVDQTPIPNGTYQAGTQLTSMGTVAGGGNVIFRAGNNVELRANFEVQATAQFEINIGPCQ